MAQNAYLRDPRPIAPNDGYLAPDFIAAMHTSFVGYNPGLPTAEGGLAPAPAWFGQPNPPAVDPVLSPWQGPFAPPAEQPVGPGTLPPSPYGLGPVVKPPYMPLNVPITSSPSVNLGDGPMPGYGGGSNRTVGRVLH